VSDLAKSAGLQRPDVKLENPVRSGNGDSVSSALLPMLSRVQRCCIKHPGATHSNRLDNAAESPQGSFLHRNRRAKAIFCLPLQPVGAPVRHNTSHEESPNTNSLPRTDALPLGQISRRAQMAQASFYFNLPLRLRCGVTVITWAFAELLVIQESGEGEPTWSVAIQ